MLALAGCGESRPSSEGEGRATTRVTLSQALGPHDVARVTLTVSGAGMATRTSLWV
ncbi:hypothetical protein MFUL124B02_22885 [Myxococcus fulvus 124B02]|nr:hypothetical protein MFUL124B02_22885 [Myxococcus fulvus 124B02]